MINYLEIARNEYGEKVCEACRSYGTTQECECLMCETKVIQELVKIIDEYKKYDGFLIAHGFFGDSFAVGHQNKIVKEEPPYLDLGGPLD